MPSKQYPSEALSGGKRQAMNDPAGREIRRLWGEIEVLDAKDDLRVFIAPEDVAHATRNDPSDCVFARACRRIFKSGKVLFYRSVAYVELPDDHGHRRVERFMMGRSTRDLIDAWDRGEQIIPEGGFLLRAPAGTDTLDGQCVAQRRLIHQRKSLEGERVIRRSQPRPEPARLDRASMAEAPGHEPPGKPAKPQGPVPDDKKKYRDEPRIVPVTAGPMRSGQGAVHFGTKKAARVRVVGAPGAIP